MRPLKLTLEGFRGIKAGMGQDRVTLDLENLAGDAVLVALVGPNGRGKTTLLDNLHPYRVMPSKLDRSTNYSPEAFSYYDHLVAPGEARKELVWEHLGTRYRSLLYWKLTAKTAKTEAYLQRQTSAGSWEPVTLPDGTTSDGKAKTYDRVVEGVLGSPRLFFTAAFSAQGRTQLSSYSQGDIKALMSEVLGLDAIQELGDKAGDVAKGLRRHLQTVRDQLQGLEAQQQQAQQLQDRIGSDKASLSMYDEAVRQTREKARAAATALAQVEKDQQDAEATRLKRQDLEQQLTQALEQQRQDTAQADQDIRAERDQQDAHRKAAADRLQSLQQQQAAAQRTKDQAGQVLAQRDAIELAAQQLPDLQQAEQEAAHALEQARADAQAAKEARAELQALDGHLQALVDAGKRASSYHVELQGRCALIDEVPCQGTDLQGRCKLLAEAREAGDRLPDAKATLEQKQAEYRQKQEARKELAAKVEGLAELEQALQQAQDAHRKAQAAVAEAQRLAARADELGRAQQQADQAAEQLDQLERAIAEHGQQVEQDQAAQAERMAELERRREAAEARQQSAIDRIRQSLDALPVPGDDSALQGARQALQQAEAAQQQAEAEADKVRGAIAHQEGQLQALSEALVKVDQLKDQAAALEAETVHWVTLQRALGRDGILSLSIDDAGPTLSSLANDLLLTCYGPRFTVRIDTQAETKGGDLRETFDIMVLDADTDEAKSVREMSGGERIWINEALTRAIALYQAQQSGHTYATLFSDEADGALDHERKQQFLRMKRRVLELGGYSREVFISHTPELWGLADHVIDLGEPLNG